MPLSWPKPKQAPIKPPYFRVQPGRKVGPGKNKCGYCRGSHSKKTCPYLKEARAAGIKLPTIPLKGNPPKPKKMGRPPKPKNNPTVEGTSSLPRRRDRKSTAKSVCKNCNQMGHFQSICPALERRRQMCRALSEATLNLTRTHEIELQEPVVSECAACDTTIHTVETCPSLKYSTSLEEEHLRSNHNGDNAQLEEKRYLHSYFSFSPLNPSHQTKPAATIYGLMAGSSSPVAPSEPPRSFASFFQKPFNVVDNKDSLVKPIKFINGTPTLEYEEDEFERLDAPHRLCLVGKFSYGRPKMDEIHKEFKKIGFNGAYTLGLMNPRHVLIRFEQEDDYQRCWIRTFWNIGGFSMRILKWTPGFRFEEDPQVVPIWVSFFDLPIEYMHPEVIYSMATALGQPLKVDTPTLNMTRPSVARFCVEVDLTKELVKSVKIGKKGRKHEQFFTFEHVPFYCRKCCKIEHKESDCRMGKPSQKNPLESPVPNVGKIVTEKLTTTTTGSLNLITVAQASNPFSVLRNLGNDDTAMIEDSEEEEVVFTEEIAAPKQQQLQDDLQHMSLVLKLMGEKLCDDSVTGTVSEDDEEESAAEEFSWSEGERDGAHVERSETGRKKAAIFQFILDALEVKLSNWKNKFLSQGGRLVLIKHVMSAIPIHVFAAIEPPKSILNAIAHRCQWFLWEGVEGDGKKHWRSWNRLTYPVLENGVGLRNFQEVWNFFAELFGQVAHGSSLREYLNSWWISGNFKTAIGVIKKVLPSFIVWELWKARNKFFFGNVDSTFSGVIKAIKEHLHGMMLVHRLKARNVVERESLQLIFPNTPFSLKQKKVRKVSWQQQHKHVLNTDGSSNSQAAGYGFVIRGEKGFFLYGEVGFLGSGDSLQAEVYGLLFGVRKCEHLDLFQVEVQTDNQFLANILASGGPCPWRFYFELREIRAILERRDYSIHHIYREANAVADSLARCASDEVSAEFFSLGDLPNFTRGLITLD
ncbi:OLC1v1001076C1 [Oldenlandia corymbosa var. corymbosa]|uniref:OLC1v1001076C1 n=1 Tax=Oldenlandia corymbosa var. corymbosa TaxID=529605 RepID=A0AAV1D647_OLDCO|nr:OLC1v1001076C1 [Oldenlandia corymbosa var. corymbosa]